MITSFFVLMELPGCSKSSEVDSQLNIAEKLMESRPDSSLFILEGIDELKLRGNRMKARFALLKSMALDKNYIDTTTFDVLYPAINYYLNKGSADEKIKTLYYKGIIHQNAADDDLAMQSYMDALNIDGIVSDSLTLARLLVAQGTLYSRLYRIEDCINNNLKAAVLFGKLGLIPQQYRSYARALNGEVSTLNKKRADSILNICKINIKNDSTLNKYMISSFLAYTVSFGRENDIRNLLEEVHKVGISEHMRLNLARAYAKIGEPKTGLQYLNEVKISPDDILDSLTYWSVKTLIMENLEENKASLESFKNYSRLLEEYHMRLFNNELLFSEKKHAMEIENMAKLHKRDRVIKWILAGVSILLLVTVLLYYRYRMNKAARLIAERNSEKLKLETDNLRLEGENQRLHTERLESEGRELRLKNENLQLEKARLQLEAENLRLEATPLADERESLE
ncbi:MAG: hypothetical protein K2H85_03280 [Allobaculum sp.]|nr:hypothetical protein [Allobaculum sp.]